MLVNTGTDTVASASLLRSEMFPAWASSGRSMLCSPVLKTSRVPTAVSVGSVSEVHAGRSMATTLRADDSAGNATASRAAFCWMVMVTAVCSDATPLRSVRAVLATNKLVTLRRLGNATASISTPVRTKSPMVWHPTSSSSCAVDVTT